MARITNYTTLVSAVVDELEDNSPEFGNYIPIAIDLAEQRLTREIDTYGLVAKTTIVTSAGVNLISKPAGYRLPYQLVQVKNDGSLNTLIKVTDEFIIQYWMTPTSTSAVLKYYADDGRDNFLIAPTPTSAYNLICKFLARPSVLDGTVLTNYFTDYTSDALYFGTLKEMCRFTKNYDLMKLYEDQYQIAVDSINNEGRRSRRDDDRATFNPEGSQNNLKEGTH